VLPAPSSGGIQSLFSVSRLQSEVDEVIGNKESVSAEDLEKLQYTEQVCIPTANTASVRCMLLIH